MFRRTQNGFYFSYYRLGIFLIITSFLWGLYLMRLHLDDRRTESEYLKEKIVLLSKQYVQALAKEKSGSLTIDGQDSIEMEDMKKATAVLLQNMLDRIHQLEEQVEHVIVNSTLEFAELTKRLQFLNRTVFNLTHFSSSSRKVCRIPPDDPSFPECRKRVQWMQENWMKYPIYAKNGVNGSLCSVLKYLSTVEKHCPSNYFDSVTIQPLVCDVPNDPAFPSCSSKVIWMRKFWTSDTKFQNHGVDGTDCSFLIYLSEVEHWCPRLQDRKFASFENDCKVPDDKAYPDCAGKVAWMKNFWRSDVCYSRDYGVNGTVCSFLVYLSEVEQFCPRLKGRAIIKKTVEVSSKLPEESRTDVEGLISLLNDPFEVKFRWIKTRLRRMWPDWVKAYHSLKLKRNVTDYSQKKILVHIGLLANEKILHFGAEAFKGGPLGELVQWSDLLASLYILGHSLTVSADSDVLKSKIAGKITKSNCPTSLTESFDLIFLDYYGVKQLMTKVGSVLPHYKCRFRVLDSFGTEAQFNYDGFKEKIEGGFSGTWGRHNLNLKQFMTMFPHSPDNSFLGFVVDSVNMTAGRPVKKNQALVYGKHYYMWQDLTGKNYLDTIHKYMEIHATVGAGKDKNDETLSKYVPSYVKNHGVLPSQDVYSLLRDSKVFVGLGTPYEGPAALEAIASGCFFLNPKNIPPKDRLNTKFFKDKPTFRALTSQHPYAEEYIGMPHVYTVNIDSQEEVEKAIQEIMKSKADPYLPYEYTHEGMLERLYSFLKHQDFCNKDSPKWPPARSLHVFKGVQGQSCKNVCHNKGYVCEPAFFQRINTASTLQIAGFPCNSTRVEVLHSLLAPAFRTENPSCLLQAQPLLFSCTSKSPSAKRLCPCRDYRKGQVALCKHC